MIDSLVLESVEDVSKAFREARIVGEKPLEQGRITWESYSVMIGFEEKLKIMGQVIWMSNQVLVPVFRELKWQRETGKDLIVDSRSLKAVARIERMVIDIPKYGGHPLT